ncbi:MAG: hypothetical protein WDZ37_04320 [Solirubrobacterales bacterium]
MTAKEKLVHAIDGLSESEARDTLHYLAERHHQDALVEFLKGVPEGEDPTTPEEEEGLREARAEVERGETVVLEDLKRELT